MYTGTVIGQEEAKHRLLEMIREDRLPHALLLCGKEGCGKLALSLWLARYLLCKNPSSEDSCGTCSSCRMFAQLSHPDMHFAFPVVKRRPGQDTVSDDYLDKWRELLLNSPYFTFSEWLNAMNAENKQAQLFVSEADEIQRKLSLRSSQGGYKIMLIWMPERMNPECANKLLKLLEEPPAQTLFLLISQEPERLLPTLISRLQRFNLPPVSKAELTTLLQTQYSIGLQDAENIAQRAQGSITDALAAIQLNEEQQLWFEYFTSLMRLAYGKRIAQLKDWSETIASLGRERQKSFMEYCQHMTRESFIYNFRREEMLYLNQDEKVFAARFSPFVNEKNVNGIYSELEKATVHIEQNANPKFVFFDLAIKMIILLKS